MDTKLLMQIAYDALIEEIAERSERVRIYKLGSYRTVLPARDFMRQTTRHDTWKRRVELSERDHNYDAEWLAKLIPLVEELEVMWEKWHEMDDKQWADAFRDFIKRKK